MKNILIILILIFSSSCSAHKYFKSYNRNYIYYKGEIILVYDYYNFKGKTYIRYYDYNGISTKKYIMIKNKHYNYY